MVGDKFSGKFIEVGLKEIIIIIIKKATLKISHFYKKNKFLLS